MRFRKFSLTSLGMSDFCRDEKKTMSKRYSHYYVSLAVDFLGEIEVKIRNTLTNKTVFDDSAYTFEHLFETYKDAKKELLEIPELKKFVERS